MKMNMKVMCFLPLSLLLAAYGCTDALRLSGPGQGELVQEIRVVTDNTKGRFTNAQINAITQLQVLIYQDGKYVSDYYFSNPSEAVVTFPNFAEHNMYIMANMGEWTAPPEDEAELENYSFRVDDYARFQTYGVPMVGIYKNFIPGSKSSFGLTRLVGCYAVTLTKSAGKLDQNKATYTLLEGRVRQAAKVIRPFGHLYSTDGVDPGIYASKAMDATEVYPADAAAGGDGDYLSSADVATLNKGGKIYLYLLENMQGVPSSLESNAEPRLKNPLNAGAMSRCCSYLELAASVTTPTMQYDRMVYRLYLGANEVNDFSIRRGTTYNLAVDFNSNAIHTDDWTTVDEGPSTQIGGVKILSQMHGLVDDPTMAAYRLKVNYIEAADGVAVGGLMEGSPKFAVLYADTRDLLETLVVSMSDSMDGRQDPNISYSIEKDYAVSAEGVVLSRAVDKKYTDANGVTYYPAQMIRFDTATPVEEGTPATKYTYATHFEFTTFDGISTAGIDLYTYTKPYPIKLKYYDGTLRLLLTAAGPHPDWILSGPIIYVEVENPRIYFTKNGMNAENGVDFSFPVFGMSGDYYSNRRSFGSLTYNSSGLSYSAEIALEDGLPFGNINNVELDDDIGTDVFAALVEKIYSWCKDAPEKDYPGEKKYVWEGYNYIPMVYTKVDLFMKFKQCGSGQYATYGKHWVLANYKEGDSDYSYSNMSARGSIYPFTDGSDGYAVYTYPSLYDMCLPFPLQLAPKDILDSQRKGPGGYPQAWNITLAGYYRKNLFVQFPWGPIGPIKMIDNVRLFTSDDENGSQTIQW